MSLETHLWASTTCYGDSFTLLYLYVIRTSLVTRPYVHGFLRGELYFVRYLCSYLIGNRYGAPRPVNMIIDFLLFYFVYKIDSKDRLLPAWKLLFRYRKMQANF
jgi:hypothetical protein